MHYFHLPRADTRTTAAVPDVCVFAGDLNPTTAELAPTSLVFGRPTHCAKANPDPSVTPSQCGPPPENTCGYVHVASITPVETWLMGNSGWWHTKLPSANFT